VASEPRAGWPFRLWPEAYEIARLRALPGEALALAADGPPIALVVGHGEVSVIAPTATVAQLGELVESRCQGWRAITLEVVLPPTLVGVLAAAAGALAEIEVPLVAFSSHDTDHILVPERSLGRALAALRQARLERLLPRRSEAAKTP